MEPRNARRLKGYEDRMSRAQRSEFTTALKSQKGQRIGGVKIALAKYILGLPLREYDLVRLRRAKLMTDVDVTRQLAAEREYFSPYLD